MEKYADNAIADATLVATLSGRIRRAAPHRRDAARLEILDLALQACYGKHLLELTESVMANSRTMLHVCVGAPEAGTSTAPKASGIVLDRARCTALIDGRSVRLTPGTSRILSALLEARGRPMSWKELAVHCPRSLSQTGVAQQIWRLRELLGAAGNRVVTVRGRGWALASEEAAADERVEALEAL